MARYSYRCDECDHQDDLLYPMGDAPAVRECTRCGQETMRRVFTPVHHRHIGPTGDVVRAPGSEWVGGDHFDSRRFWAENPSARPRKRARR